MKAPNHPKLDDFIAPARRAFRRVARQLRVENARLGLPLIVGERGGAKRVEPQADPTKPIHPGDAPGLVRLHNQRPKLASRLESQRKR